MKCVLKNQLIFKKFERNVALCFYYVLTIVDTLFSYFSKCLFSIIFLICKIFFIISYKSAAHKFSQLFEI